MSCKNTYCIHSIVSEYTGRKEEFLNVSEWEEQMHWKQTSCVTGTCRRHRVEDQIEGKLYNLWWQRFQTNVCPLPHIEAWYFRKVPSRAFPWKSLWRFDAIPKRLYNTWKLLANSREWNTAGQQVRQVNRRWWERVGKETYVIKDGWNVVRGTPSSILRSNFFVIKPKWRISRLYSEILPCFNPCLLITASVLAKANVQAVHSVPNGFQIFLCLWAMVLFFLVIFKCFSIMATRNEFARELIIEPDLSITDICWTNMSKTRFLSLQACQVYHQMHPEYQSTKQESTQNKRRSKELSE